MRRRMINRRKAHLKKGRTQEVLANGDIMIYDANGRPVKRIESEQHKKDRKYYEGYNIGKRKPELPESVCILGPGINAVKDDAYRRITADYIISVNYSVLIDQCEKIAHLWPKDRTIDAWCLQAYDVEAVPWFKEMFPKLNKTRFFSTDTCIDVVGIPLPWDSGEFYTFVKSKRHAKDDIYIHERGLFQPSTTVIGIAIAIAVFCGAKRIELCGCDLKGNEYYDNTERGLPQGVHVDCGRLDNLIKYYQEQGVEIVTLSWTALSNPSLWVAPEEEDEPEDILEQYGTDNEDTQEQVDE